jgi:hypothetical protein
MSAHEHSSIAIRQDPAWRRARFEVARRLLPAIQRWQRKQALAALQALPDFYLESMRTAGVDIEQIASDLFPEEGRTVPVYPTRAPDRRLRNESRNAARRLPIASILD